MAFINWQPSLSQKISYLEGEQQLKIQGYANFALSFDIHLSKLFIFLSQFLWVFSLKFCKHSGGNPLPCHGGLSLSRRAQATSNGATG